METSWLHTAPATEPIALDEATKRHLRIEDAVTEDDALIVTDIEAVRQWAETFTGRAFISQTWDLKLDWFPSGRIVLPRPPVTAVTFIQYIDTAGTTQTLSSSLYRVELPTGPLAAPAHIEPAYGETWPSTQSVSNAVTVRYVCGYGTKGVQVPANIRKAMLLRLGTLYEQREGMVVGTIASPIPRVDEETMLWPFKVWR